MSNDMFQYLNSQVNHLLVKLRARIAVLFEYALISNLCNIVAFPKGWLQSDNE